ncbi:MAG: ATP-binding protein [Dokdonella sp.]
MRWFSLEGKLAATAGLAIIFAAVLAAALTQWLGSAAIAATATVALLLAPALMLAQRLAQPVTSLIRALAGSVVAFRDGDFSFSIANRRRDELGELVDAHNALGGVLREQRQNLFQRELLLDTVVQNTPVATVLVEPGGHIVYANVAARHLLNGGRALNGMRFDEIVAHSADSLAQALAAGQDALFSASVDGEDETFHLLQRSFSLQGRAHRLYLIRRMTRELARQEVATWKKVIRVISHEINNSLGPIRSLSHSGQELARRGDAEKLDRVFATIEERTRHLEGFISGYARFAKLPAPQPVDIHWSELLDALERQYSFERLLPLPENRGYFDRIQIEQALINMLKNAHEAGGDSAKIEVAIETRGRNLRIEVRDRGNGMTDSVLAQALLPFYSTKRSGSGLGLALVREIAEAHDGRVQLGNRDGGGLVVALILPLLARDSAVEAGEE